MGSMTIWSPTKLLTWDHFEADPNPGMYQDAVAIIRYGCNWTVESHKSDNLLFFTICNIRLTTNMVRNLSWTRTADPAILEHMQGCFDLAEMMRPDMEAHLASEFGQRRYPVRGSSEAERKQNSQQDSQIVLSNLDRVHHMLHTAMTKYETATDYGLNEEAQAKYTAMFEEQRSRSASGMPTQ